MNVHVSFVHVSFVSYKGPQHDYMYIHIIYMWTKEKFLDYNTHEPTSETCKPKTLHFARPDLKIASRHNPSIMNVHLAIQFK